MEKLRIENWGWRIDDGELNQRSEVRNEELKLKIEIMAEVKVKGQKSEVRNGKRSEVRNEEWEMVNGKWEMGNGKWEMRNGKWEMGNGKWEMKIDFCELKIEDK